MLSTYSGGPEQVWSVAAGNHAVAAYYRNGTIHHFVNRAITELTLLSAATAARRTPPERPYSALREALKLRSLLEYEFYFPDKVQFADELVTELDLVAPNWRELGGAPEDAQAILRQEDLLLARRTLQPFIDAQLVVAEQLVEWGERSFDEGAFLDRCLTVGRQQLLQNRIRTPESVSRELYAGAVGWRRTAACSTAPNRASIPIGADWRTRFARCATNSLSSRRWRTPRGSDDHGAGFPSRDRGDR